MLLLDPHVFVNISQLSPEYFFSTYPTISRLIIATAVGLLLGIEREWSDKPAGLRTFTVITVVATVMTIADEPELLILGGTLVMVLGVLLSLREFLEDSETLLLTTSISMILAYGVGVLIGQGLIQEGVLVAIITSFLLALRRELHAFAHNLSKSEIRSALEFAIIAFVIFPLLPTAGFGPENIINPRSIWLLVVAVSAIGFANYLIVNRYGTRGIAVTSFFGGFVNSTAVIGELVSRTREDSNLSSIAVGVVVLANSAMALRDLVIVGVFVPELIFHVGIPLGTITIVGIGLSFLMSDWDAPFELEFESPFKLQTALKFGALFVLVLLGSATARAVFGSSGLVVSSFFGGLISSAAVTTSVVVLVQSGQIGANLAALGIFTAVSASILVKVGLVFSMDRSISRPVGLASMILILAGILSTSSAYILL